VHGNAVRRRVKSSQQRNHFEIRLKLANQQGTIRDWLVITENSVGKVVALANAARVDLPSDADVVDTAKLALSQGYVDQFIGKSVGVVIRNETDYKDPTQERPRVQGYVDRFAAVLYSPPLT